ncbi:MAG: autotransporter outer membrane beta-barrel domain-containing protein, partial [Acidaminococcaceae bacterium]|nr:autotransporter outer membrane beta-barrel domain-containing protein [Acidaminococcaceae bacterium]
NGGHGATGSIGGLATVYGLHSSGGTTVLTADSISAAATGGTGGVGGNGGDGRGSGSAGTGGKGGDGGRAVAYGLYSSGGITILTADSISAQASGGTGGSAGGNGTDQLGGTHTDSPSGANATAEAYGVYAEQGAVMTLNAKTNNGTIKIAAKAGNTATTEGSKAYAIYADNATVLFGSNAELNTSDGTTANPDVITYLKDATIGFGTPGEGQNVGRTIIGGTLQLEGSNTFRVATDLANNKADSFKFESLAGSSTATQYITVGYDKSFDGSKLDSLVGDVTVLTVEDLKGQSLNFVGKESEMDDPLTRFLATPTVEVGADGTGNGGVVKITQIDFKEDGASETVLTVADAQMSIANLWRVEGNNLMKRMGELRSDPEAAEGGVWARYYRGEMSADSAYDRSFDQDYTAFQGGIDKVQDYKGGKLYTGIAVNRIDSNASYLAGSGDLSSTGVGLYASWLGSKGHYLDVIARGSKLANDFKLVDKNGREANADYDTWAYGISAEYGYRQNLNAGWFVEPQAELSLGRIGSADYTTSNGVSIKQDAVNSAVTRLGVLSGKEFTMNGRQGNVYLKASLLHDFGGNGGGAAYYNGRSTVVESADMSSTWWEIGLGANLGIAKNSNLYFDALKTFGGDLRTDWQFNAGLRFTF